MIFLMLDEIMVRQRWRPSRAGLVLGLLCAGQFLISTEVFVTTLILGIAFVVVLAVTGHKVVRQRYRRVIRSLSYAAGIAALLLAYPLWFTFQGPAHVNGAPHSVQDLARYPGDLLGGVLPTELKRFGPSAMLQAGTQLTGGNVFENGMYLGLPLIVLLIAFVIYLRRNRAILVAGAMAFISYVLSLGPYLYIDGHNTRIVMPEYVLSKLGLLQDILAVRFSLFTALFTAAMLAIGLGELHQRWLTHSLRSRTSRLARWLVLVALIAAVGLPLLPRASYPSVATEIPPYFTTSSVHAIDEGDVALTYPYPGPVTEQAILAQAAAGMRFKVFGGYAFVPGDNGIPIPPPVAPPTVEQLFTAAYDSGTLPAPGAATNASIRSFLVHHHVGAIICEHVGSHPATVVNYISAVVGLPTTTQGVTVWLNVPERLRDAKAYPRARLPIDKTPPSTRILRPISGAVLKGHEWLAASASDEFGVAKVEFEFAGVGRPETIIDTAVPFSLGWLGSWNTSTVPNGTYTLRSVAIDPTGLTSASAGVVVTVGN
jgi:hypothetical protein